MFYILSYLFEKKTSENNNKMLSNKAKEFLFFLHRLITNYIYILDGQSFLQIGFVFRLVILIFT
jgi:hypothetical protein